MNSAPALVSFIFLAKYFKVYIINIKDNYVCLVKI
jgi:hypothetical protein